MQGEYFSNPWWGFPLHLTLEIHGLCREAPSANAVASLYAEREENRRLTHMLRERISTLRVSIPRSPLVPPPYPLPLSLAPLPADPSPLAPRFRVPLVKEGERRVHLLHL